MKDVKLKPEIFLDAAEHLKHYSCVAVNQSCDAYLFGHNTLRPIAYKFCEDHEYFYNEIMKSYHNENGRDHLCDTRYNYKTWWNSFQDDEAEWAEDCRLYALLFAYELAKDFVNETEENKELYKG